MVSEQLRRSYAAAFMVGEESGDEVPAPIGSNSQDLGVDDISNPLYLHIRENTNTILVSPCLSEHNYNTWSRSMRMALEVKNKLGFINGIVPRPNPSDPKLTFWKRCNTIVCSWILKSVSSSIAESIMYFEKSVNMWKDMENRFSQGDPHRISQLQRSIFNNKQGDSSITDYYSRCRGLWEHMATLRPLPCCECVPRCSCSLVSKIRKEREEDQVIRFLEGLNNEYDSIKSSVLVLEPFPTIDKVFKMAIKLERKIVGSSLGQNIGGIIHVNASQGIEVNNEEIIAATSGSNSGFVNNGMNNRRFNNGKSTAKFTFCGMSGHTVDKCYKKNGYFPGWVPRYKSKGKMNQNMHHTPNNHVNQVGELGLSNEQFQRLLSFMQSQGGQSSSTVTNVSLVPDFKLIIDDSNTCKCSSIIHINNVLNCATSWILDSWAIDHIVCSLDYFDNCYKIHGAMVNLPNGETVTVTHVGDITLSHTVLLKNVLYIIFLLLAST